MTQFLRLLGDNDKAGALLSAGTRLRLGEQDPHHYEVEPEKFRQVPGAPFGYWVSDVVRGLFNKLPAFNTGGRVICVGDHPGDGFRYLRISWEVQLVGTKPVGWVPYQKGGIYSPFYADIHLVAYWNENRQSYEGFYGRPGRSSERPSNFEHFFRPGLTWPRRTQSGLGMRVMPAGCIFADKGPAAFVEGDDPDELLALLAVTTTTAFCQLVELQMAFGSYEVGVIQRTPVPPLPTAHCKLSALAKRAWSLKRSLDMVEETSHAFLLPTALCLHLGDYDPPVIKAELVRIQAEIEAIAMEMYGLDEEEFITENADAEKGNIGKDAVSSEANQVGLLSWCAGVAFGRFDWRLATGEREPPPEPEPFDPLPAKSPGMLSDAAEPFHHHAGILVDDPGHPHDLARLIESVLERVDAPVPSEVCRWLQRDFFKEHLKQYSKSRRKAPIYWPLATASGSYTLWVYYPALTAQTLYTAVNDFVEPKLKSISQTAEFLQGKTDRSKVEERELEQLQDFELELTDLRDTLLQVAKDYAPNHDDGVQITAAPLWPLFRHKPWQKVLKETWKKLEKGDYDWAHLAMNYWPERVRDKCKTDKSLAIAHGLEELYEEPPEQRKKKRGRGKAE